jgi:DNA (cytosine-5)-methyltransferase 1
MKKLKKQFKSLSLFSGIGGFEVGMSQLGFQFAKHLEWDEKCCETLTSNFSESLAIAATDITKIEAPAFYQGDIEYIVGGPPCQSFSAAGRRAGGVKGINDTRGSLFWYYCQYVKHFTPKAFVFENVRGILSSKNGEDFEIICNAFRDINYKLYWRVLNAADYGVPQIRERLFLVGIRGDIDMEFKFPRPTYGPDSLDRRPYHNVGDALNDLWDESEIIPEYGGKYGHLIPDIPEGENYRFYTEEMGHPSPQFAWRSKFSGFLQKLSRNDLSKTIVAYQSRYDGPFHWNNRKCNIGELKRLQGFPDSFVINQKYGEAVKQIGNSVCPPVAQQIGKALLFQLEGVDSLKVPLLEENEKLSFDSRKRERAKKSSTKIVKRYKNLTQPDLFDENKSPESKNTEALAENNFENSETKDGYRIKRKFSNKILSIKINSNKGITHSASLILVFKGGVTDALKKITVNANTHESDEAIFTLVWLEIHDAIKGITTYESLQPLYGHFTEPYPKFEISFDSNLKTDTAFFQKISIDVEVLNKILKYEKLKAKTSDIESFLRKMREFGFDVRTNSTNRTIPEGSFKICYPFTLPKALLKKGLWTEKGKSKKNDFDITKLQDNTIL